MKQLATKVWIIILALALYSTPFNVHQPALAYSGASGIWNTDYGKMTIPPAVPGPIRGTYELDGGRIIGQVTGHVFTGIWIENGSSVNCDPQVRDGSLHWGNLRLEFNQDFTEFKGLWAYCGEAPNRGWNGTRIGGAPDPEAALSFYYRSGPNWQPAGPNGVPYGTPFLVEAAFDKAPDSAPVIDLDWPGMPGPMSLALRPVAGSDRVFRSRSLVMDPSGRVVPE
ncbi:MAG: hypothetical protein V3R73_01395 [Sphingomonadales bacterium]